MGFKYQPAIDFRRRITPAMAINFSETKNSINATGVIHKAADAYAFTTKRSTIKIHKRLQCTGYHLSPYIHFTNETQESRFLISLDQSLLRFEAIDAIASGLAVPSQNPHIIHKTPD